MSFEKPDIGGLGKAVEKPSKDIQAPDKSNNEDTLPALEKMDGACFEFVTQSESDALKTPKKKTRGGSATPRKSAKKGGVSSGLKKTEKQVYCKTERGECDTPDNTVVCVGQEDSSGYSDVSETEDGELNRTLDRKAKNINLSKRNVKSIIHHLLTNEHVIKLYKDALSAQDTDDPDQGLRRPNAMGSLDSFPKMTRSKVKDFMEKSNIPPSPCKKQSSGPSILEVDFAEEEDDDEYSPEKDETNETDDDESVVSSHLSEFGSPYPLTPSTPVPVVACPDKVPLSMSPSITNSPLTSASKRLKIDLSGCEGLSEAEDEGTIALRTRSKRSLMDTSLMDIEQAFVAPDITPDMYDTTCYQDKDWADFLNSLYKTNADESTVDDEVSDPEFNYIAEAEEEAFDDEDFRFDKPTKVSKKELNSLIEELHNLFEDEVLPLQVVAEASSNADPLSQLVSSNFKESPTSGQVSRSHQMFPVPIQRPHPPSTTPSGQVFPSPTSVQATQSNLPSLNHQQFVVMQSHTPCASQDFNFKVPDLPPQTPPSTSSFSLQPTSQGHSPHHPQSGALQHHQRLVLQDNIRKHIQLLTQTFLLSNAGDDKGKIATTAKGMVVDLNWRQSCAGASSVVDVCNLKEAVQLVTDKSYTMHKGDLEECKTTIFNNRVFMYSHLLPRFDKVTNKIKASSQSKRKFLPSEDNLIALGLEQFADCAGVFPSELIQQHLMHPKSVNDIYHRIRYLTSSKSGINPVKKFRQLGQPVELAPPPIHPVDFRPPKFKLSDELPDWCRKFQHRGTTTAESPASFVIFTQSSTAALLNKPKTNNSLVKIRPKLTRNHSDNKQKSFSSSVISHRRRRVDKKTSSNWVNHPIDRGKEVETPSPSPVCLESTCVNYLPLNGSAVECAESPDLLQKAMESCGIDEFPSPTSASTPLPTDRQKPSSVKNLASAFDESEVNNIRNKEQKQCVDSGIPRVMGDSHMTPSRSKDTADIVKGPDGVNSCENSKTGCVVSLVSRGGNSHIQKNSGDSSLRSANVGGVGGNRAGKVIRKSGNEEFGESCRPNDTPMEQDVTIEEEGLKRNDGNVKDSMSGKRNKSNNGKELPITSKAKTDPAKNNVIQLTAIKKSAVESDCQDELTNRNNTKDVNSGERNDLSSSNTVCVEANTSTLDAASDGGIATLDSQPDLGTQAVEHSGTPHSPSGKDECGKGRGSSTNNLVPWIESIISQYKPPDSLPGNKPRAPTQSTPTTALSPKPKHTSTPPDKDLQDIPIELFRSPESSPLKLTLFSTSSPKQRPIAPKMSPCTKSAPYIPLPRVSPKRKELNRQVRHILPKSFVFESKSPSPTKATALSLKKKAALLCQKSPIKILPRPPSGPGNDRDTATSTRSRSTMLTRSQRGISKPKRREEPPHKVLKRVKKLEEDYESPRETESEASEMEEAAWSQEEDEDRIKLDDLMAASTTIRFGSRQPTAVDDDVKTKAERKKAMSLSLLQPDLVQNDPKKDDRDTAFAQHYFNQVKQTLSSDPERFYKFLSLLKDLNRDHTSPVELYLDMVSLLSDHQQLVEDFSGFLLSFQALECHCFASSFQYCQIRQFLRQVEVHCGSSSSMYRKALKALSTWSTMCQEGRLEGGGLKDKMATILKNVPGVLDNLIGYFLDGTISECHAEDFEDVCMEDVDDVATGDEFEDIVLPDGPESYNTKTCGCHCHSNGSLDERYQRRIKHCISCSLQIYEGQPVLKVSRNEFRPVTIVYPSEEKYKEKGGGQLSNEENQKLSDSRVEESQTASVTTAQREQAGKKRNGGLKGSRPKRVRKQLDKAGGDCSSDSNDDCTVNLGSEISRTEVAQGKGRLKKDKTSTTQLTKRSKVDKEVKLDKETRADSGGKDNRHGETSRKAKLGKTKSKSEEQREEITSRLNPRIKGGLGVLKQDEVETISVSQSFHQLEEPRHFEISNSKGNDKPVVSCDQKDASKNKTSKSLKAVSSKMSQGTVEVDEKLLSKPQHPSKDSDSGTMDKPQSKPGDSSRENDNNAEEKCDENGKISNKRDRVIQSDLSKGLLKSNADSRSPPDEDRKMKSTKPDVCVDLGSKGRPKKSQETLCEKLTGDEKEKLSTEIKQSASDKRPAQSSHHGDDENGSGQGSIASCTHGKDKDTPNMPGKPLKRETKRKPSKLQSKGSALAEGDKTKKVDTRKRKDPTQDKCSSKRRKKQCVGPAGDVDLGGGTRSEGDKSGARSEGDKDGARSKGDKDGARSEGDKAGIRSEGDKDGARSKGDKDGARSKGNKDGARSKGDKDGTRSEDGILRDSHQKEIGVKTEKSVKPSPRGVSCVIRPSDQHSSNQTNEGEETRGIAVGTRDGEGVVVSTTAMIQPAKSTTAMEQCSEPITAKVQPVKSTTAMVQPLESTTVMVQPLESTTAMVQPVKSTTALVQTEIQGKESGGPENVSENENVTDDSEMFEFDRCILHNLSDEGLTEAALKVIHDAFPLKTLTVIQDRANLLMSMLEDMSDGESTDME